MEQEYYKNFSLESLHNEEWRDVPDYEGRYQVSNLGRVKSLERQVNHPSGKKRIVKETILKQQYNHNKYLMVGLSKNRKISSKTVHRLVGIVFLGYKKEMYNKGFIVDHKNNHRTNNQKNNLQIITKRLNVSKDQKSFSKYTGVVFNKPMGKYIAQISIDGKLIYLGCFTDEKKASKYYQDALFSYENGLAIKRKARIPKSKYLGVYKSPNNNWYAQKLINGKRKHLGTFKTEIEAHRAVINHKTS